MDLLRISGEHQVKQEGHQSVTNRSNGPEVTKTRSIEDVGTGLFEGLQSPDRVIQIGAPPKEVLTPRRQHEFMRQCAASRRAGFDTLDHQSEIENRIVAPIGVIFDGAAS